MLCACAAIAINLIFIYTLLRTINIIYMYICLRMIPVAIGASRQRVKDYLRQ